MIDEIFKNDPKKQFEFDEEVALVFDDMIHRSVPFYNEVIELVSDVAIKYAKENARIYDLGCSTANTLLSIYQKLPHKDVALIGVDTSSDMLNIARNKAHAYGAPIEFLQADILDVAYKNADIFISNYTLQFIRPMKRAEFIKSIYERLNEGGIFIFSEKVISEDSRLNKELIDIYFDYKRTKGYSESEIMQKRVALENVLVPFTDKENEQMFLKSGFKRCEILFKWVNFSTFVAIK